jgi:hypothetical protein
MLRECAQSGGYARVEVVARARHVQPHTQPEASALRCGGNNDDAQTYLHGELHAYSEEHRAIALLALRTRRRKDGELKHAVSRSHVRLSDRRCDDAPPTREHDAPRIGELLAQFDGRLIDLDLAKNP